MKHIKFLVMDVDGTLTDGKIYMGQDGEILKCFNIKDGCGIKDILPQYNVIPVVITARENSILKRRCDELGVENLFQAVSNKSEQLKEVLNFYSQKENKIYSYRDVAYIGDDLPDLPCMSQIKEAGGIVGCPHDAVSNIIQIADYVCDKNGGNGAVREFIEWLVMN